MKLQYLIIILFFCNHYIIAQQETDVQPGKFSTSTSITIDNVVNMKGGIEKGYTPLGMFDFNLDVTPFKNNLLKNTSFYGHLLKTAGTGASENYIGDVQVASNIEGNAYRFIYELLVKQKLGDFLLTFGLHDLNSEFMCSEFAGDFINSSFGIPPAVSLNIPVSIFPVTSTGSILSYSKDSYDVTFGLYNINNDFVEEEMFSFANHFYQKGQLAIGEFRYRWMNNEKFVGEYKIGGYLNSNIDITRDNPQYERFYQLYKGFYIIGDQTLYRIKDNMCIGMFGQLNISYQSSIYAPEYYGMGLSVRNLQYKLLPDFIGCAFGMASINNSDNFSIANTRETVIELNMKKELNKYISIQPDIQYIFNPGGQYKDAFVGLLRLQIDLNN